MEVIHGRISTRWQCRARGALETLRRSGAAHRVDRGTWVTDGEPEQPRRAVLVHTGGTLAEVELRLQDAVELLANLDGPVDLILGAPPYGLLRGTADAAGVSAYRRDRTKVVAGYREVDPAAYKDFTWRWLTAAAEALRPALQEMLGATKRVTLAVAAIRDDWLTG